VLALRSEPLSSSSPFTPHNFDKVVALPPEVVRTRRGQVDEPPLRRRQSQHTAHSNRDVRYKGRGIHLSSMLMVQTGKLTDDVAGIEEWLIRVNRSLTDARVSCYCRPATPLEKRLDPSNHSLFSALFLPLVFTSDLPFLCVRQSFRSKILRLLPCFYQK